MDNLITIADFSNPNMVYGPVGTDDEIFLNQIIAYNQKDILIDILGEIEYNNFEDDLTGIIPDSAQWIDFLDGETYTYDSVKYKFLGIKPILIKFVYYYWQRKTAVDLAQSGALNKTLKNAVQIIPVNEMVRAWNDAVNDIKNVRIYGTTVYNFLDHMQDNNGWFGDWDYTSFETISIL